MQKNFLKVALLSTVVLLQGNPVYAQEQSSAPVPSYITSRNVFRSMMNDPELNRLHLRAQESRLKTAIDYNMQRYFDSNLSLQQMLVPYMAQLDASVTQTTSRNQLNMTEITKDSAPRLRYKLEQMMRIQGYSDQEIKDTLFYRAEGGINAYAYTYSTSRVAFVLLSGLDDIASSRELMGVFGHESGHIRGGHVKYGMQNTIMMMRVMRALYAKTNADEEAEDSAHLRSMLTNIAEKQAALMSKATYNHEGTVASRGRDFSKIMQDVASHIQQEGPGPEIMQLNEYLDMVISSIKTLEVPARYVAILENAKARLSPTDPIGVDLAQLNEALGVWSLAYSRELETSADYFGNIIGRPSRTAMMDARFAGRKLPATPSNEDIRKTAKTVIAQVEKAQKLNTRADYYEIVGGPGSSDHPNSNLRVLRSLNFDQNIDRIALENPFLQIVTDLDQARAEKIELSFRISDLREFRKVLVAQGKDREQKMLDAGIKSLLLRKKTMQENILKIEPQIVRLLEDPAFVKKHPRSTDLLDLRLAQKQLLEKDLAAIEAMPESKSPLAEKAKAFLRESLQQFGKEAILQTALKTMDNPEAASAEQKALGLAKKALAENANAEQTLAARKALSELSGSSARIALDVTREVKSANTSSLVKGVFKGEEGLLCLGLFK